MSNKDDGGYYALKGFDFQVDKTILEILSSVDENKKISIEQIQDINANDFVMQVKYKETQDFKPSKIKEPVVQLIHEFLKNVGQDISKVYYLYCFFKDKNNYTESVDLILLDKILGNKNEDFTKVQKEIFLTKFKLVFSPSFQLQFEQVIEKLRENNLGSDDEESIFYYSNIADFLRKKVILNLSQSDRNSTKKEILELLKLRKTLVFNSTYREFLGRQNYFKFIKSKFFTYTNIDDFERFFIIEIEGSESIVEIKNVVFAIKNKFYVLNRRGLKSGAPYIYFKKITDERLKELKKALQDEGHHFKDGYDFHNADFCLDTIKEPSTKDNLISIKFINSDENVLLLIKENLYKTKEVYQFFRNNDALLDFDSTENTKIKIENLEDIINIIN
jgi:hypothetical protein